MFFIDSKLSTFFNFILLCAFSIVYINIFSNRVISFSNYFWADTIRSKYFLASLVSYDSSCTDLLDSTLIKVIFSFFNWTCNLVFIRHYYAYIICIICFNFTTALISLQFSHNLYMNGGLVHRNLPKNTLQKKGRASHIAQPA